MAIKSLKRKAGEDEPFDTNPNLIAIGPQSAVNQQSNSISNTNGHHFAQLPGLSSNLLELEIQELLSEIKGRAKSRTKNVDAFLHQIKNVIDEIPERLPCTVNFHRKVLF
jgi:hypothetical protein